MKAKKAARDSKSYQQARRRALARLRSGFDLHWTSPRSRSELHDRYTVR
jgi:hypothetical protein